MPAAWDEFAADLVAYSLAESRSRAEVLLDLAQTLQTRLPGTRAALDDGTITRSKAEIIARATSLLDDAEAAAAEQEVLDRAGRLTPGGLRAAIARAVMEVAPKKAKERRETAAKDARVERWAEDSGNATLMGCELPPAEVLAADQRITAWAKELGTAGLEGDMDQLRARAYLDLLLGKDSRPRRSATPGGDGDACPDQPAEPLAPGPGDGAVPAGFAGRVTLTVPLATLTGLADRPGELSGLGPIDPWLARDLATAAARNPKTTWCVTVTDGKGHAVGHGCARPEPKSRRNRAGPGPPPDGNGFSFTPASRDGPPGGHGTWTLRTPGPGPGLIITLDPLPPTPATTGTNPVGMTPGSSCGTCPRSGMPPAPAPSAADPPPSATSSTTPPLRQAAALACATPALNAGTTTASSSTPSGRWTSCPTGPSAGPPRPAGPTDTEPTATPSDPVGGG